MTDTAPGLVDLAVRHGTDKWGGHGYARHYDTHFARLRQAPVRLLEIGIGGDEDPHAGGASLRMWRDYFPQGRIHGVDVWDKRPHDGERITTHKGSQDDRAFLEALCREHGPFDVIVDDGSHHNRHVLASFDILYPHLKPGGLYAIEDAQTAYWRPFGGSSVNVASRRTSIGFAKSLVESLNWRELDRPGHRPSLYDQTVVGLHFYHNLIIVDKDSNDEPSNLVVDNRLPDFRRLARERRRRMRLGA
jgi:hypothetical protein